MSELKKKVVGCHVNFKLDWHLIWKFWSSVLCYCQLSTSFTTPTRHLLFRASHCCHLHSGFWLTFWAEVTKIDINKAYRAGLLTMHDNDQLIIRTFTQKVKSMKSVFNSHNFLCTYYYYLSFSFIHFVVVVVVASFCCCFLND